MRWFYYLKIHNHKFLSDASLPNVILSHVQKEFT